MPQRGEGRALSDFRRFYDRPALATDANELLKYVRPADADEWAISVVGGLKHLEGSILAANRLGGEARSVVDSETGRVMMIGGAQPQPQSPGTILTWLVLSDDCERLGITFMRDYRDRLDAFFSRWPRTECFSDARNATHHRWLSYIGYRPTGVVPWGPYSLPFLHFTKGFT
jgi:hypothetical protein